MKWLIVVWFVLVPLSASAQNKHDSGYTLQSQITSAARNAHKVNTHVHIAINSGHMTLAPNTTVPSISTDRYMRRHGIIMSGTIIIDKKTGKVISSTTQIYGNENDVKDNTTLGNITTGPMSINLNNLNFDSTIGKTKTEPARVPYRIPVLLGKKMNEVRVLSGSTKSDYFKLDPSFRGETVQQRYSPFRWEVNVDYDDTKPGPWRCIGAEFNILRFNAPVKQIIPPYVLKGDVTLIPEKGSNTFFGIVAKPRADEIWFIRVASNAKSASFRRVKKDGKQTIEWHQLEQIENAGVRAVSYGTRNFFSWDLWVKSGLKDAYRLR